MSMMMPSLVQGPNVPRPYRAPLRPAQTRRPVDLSDGVFLLDVPTSEPLVDRWLTALGASCGSFIAAYEVSRAETIPAVRAVLDRERDAYLRAKAASKHGVIVFEPWGHVDTTRLCGAIADAIYAHCLRRLGRVPGDLVASKPAGAAELSAPVALGLGLVSIAFWVAVGAVGMHYYEKRPAARRRTR
jgi:hypothetical protein